MVPTENTVRFQLAHSRFLIPLALCLVFILWRVTVFTMAHPVFFHDDHEELYRGMVARELASGTQLPLWNYRPDNYAGGFYVIVTLLSVFMKPFGFSMLGLKAFGIVQTCLTMLVWYEVLVRYVNQRTALIFSAIYLFAPFRYIVLSSLAFGDHAETCLFSALTVLLFFQILHKPGKNFSTYLALGLLAGFSLWFAYIYAVTLAALFLFLIVNYRFDFFNKRNILILLAGFMTGFSFWIAFNFHQEFSGLVIQGSPVWKLFDINNLWKPFLSWREFFFIKLFEHPRVPPIWQPLHNTLLMSYVIAFAGMIGAFLFYFLRNPGEKLRAFLKSPVGLSAFYIFCFLFIQQMFEAVGLRFLVPFFPFGLVLVAYGLSELSAFKPRWTILGMAILLTLAIISTVLRFDLTYAGEYVTRKGYSIKTLGNAVGIRPRIESILTQEFATLPASNKSGYLMAYVGQLSLEEGAVADEIMNASRRVPQAFHEYYFYLAGREVMHRYLDLPQAIQLLEPLRAAHPVFFEQAVRGIFGAVIQLDPFEMNVEEVKKKIPADLVSKLAAYEGFQFAKQNLPAERDFEKFSYVLKQTIQDFDWQRKQQFLRGVGRYLFRVWNEDPYHSPVKPSDLELFSQDIRQALFEGVAAQILRKHIVRYSSPIRWNWEEFFHELNTTGQQDLVAGLKYAMQRWGLPKEIIPMDQLSGLEIFE